MQVVLCENKCGDEGVGTEATPSCFSCWEGNLKNFYYKHY